MLRKSFNNWCSQSGWLWQPWEGFSHCGRGKILKLLWIAWFIHHDLLSARAVLNLSRYAWSERISIWFICECPCGFKVNRSFYRIGSHEGFDETTRSMWHRLVSFSSVSYLLYLSCSIVWQWLSRQEKFGTFSYVSWNLESPSVFNHRLIGFTFPVRVYKRLHQHLPDITTYKVDITRTDRFYLLLASEPVHGNTSWFA